MIAYLKSLIGIVDDEICLRNDGNLLVVSSPGSAGVDLSPTERVVIPAFGRAAIKHKLYIEKMPNTYKGKITGRSGNNLAGKFRVEGGTIDSDYRGEISTIIVNETNQDLVLETDTRISQLLIERCYPPSEIKCSNMVVRNRVRGVNGFGSSGK